MISSHRTIIIIPAYNEEKNIIKVINSLKNENPDWDIIVINDGSIDKTYQLAESTGKAFVVDLPLNLGIGGAVQTGFIFADRNNYDFAVQFDGDGQHIASEIPKILEPIISGSYDVVIGSRFLSDNSDSWKSSLPRRIGIKIFQIINSILIKQPITDNTSGFRAYNKRAIKLLSQVYPQDYPEPEAVIILGRYRMKIGENAVQMLERTGGKSSINAFNSIYYMIKVILSILITYVRANKYKI